MPAFAIYYGDGSVVRGDRRPDWVQAPDTGVQFVVVEAPCPDPFPLDERFLTGIVGRNRLNPNVTIFTGVDTYDPVGFGQLKVGTLVDDATYDAIWQQVLSDYPSVM